MACSCFALGKQERGRKIGREGMEWYFCGLYQSEEERNSVFLRFFFFFFLFSVHDFSLFLKEVDQSEITTHSNFVAACDDKKKKEGIAGKKVRYSRARNANSNV